MRSSVAKTAGVASIPTHPAALMLLQRISRFLPHSSTMIRTAQRQYSTILRQTTTFSQNFPKNRIPSLTRKVSAPNTTNQRLFSDRRPENFDKNPFVIEVAGVNTKTTQNAPKQPQTVISKSTNTYKKVEKPSATQQPAQNAHEAAAETTTTKPIATSPKTEHIKTELHPATNPAKNVVKQTESTTAAAVQSVKPASTTTLTSSTSTPSPTPTAQATLTPPQSTQTSTITAKPLTPPPKIPDTTQKSKRFIRLPGIRAMTIGLIALWLTSLFTDDFNKETLQKLGSGDQTFIASQITKGYNRGCFILQDITKQFTDTAEKGIHAIKSKKPEQISTTKSTQQKQESVENVLEIEPPSSTTPPPAADADINLNRLQSVPQATSSSGATFIDKFNHILSTGSAHSMVFFAKMQDSFDNMLEKITHFSATLAKKGQEKEQSNLSAMKPAFDAVPPPPIHKALHVKPIVREDAPIVDEFAQKTEEMDEPIYENDKIAAVPIAPPQPQLPVDEDIDVFFENMERMYQQEQEELRLQKEIEDAQLAIEMASDFSKNTVSNENIDIETENVDIETENVEELLDNNENLEQILEITSPSPHYEVDPQIHSVIEDLIQAAVSEIGVIIEDDEAPQNFSETPETDEIEHVIEFVTDLNPTVIPPVEEHALVDELFDAIVVDIETPMDTTETPAMIEAVEINDETNNEYIQESHRKRYIDEIEYINENPEPMKLDSTTMLASNAARNDQIIADILPEHYPQSAQNENILVTTNDDNTSTITIKFPQEESEQSQLIHESQQKVKGGFYVDTEESGVTTSTTTPITASVTLTTPKEVFKKEPTQAESQQSSQSSDLEQTITPSSQIQQKEEKEQETPDQIDIIVPHPQESDQIASLKKKSTFQLPADLEAELHRITALITSFDARVAWTEAQNASAIESGKILNQAEIEMKALSTRLNERLTLYQLEREDLLDELHSKLVNYELGTERLVQLLEQSDHHFFNECREMIVTYTQSALNAAISSSRIANAQQAIKYAEKLESEVRRVHDALSSSFHAQHSFQLDQLKRELHDQYSANIFQISLQHSKDMDQLTDQYNTVIDTMVEKVDYLHTAVISQQRHREQIELVQKITVALIEAERLLSRGESLDLPISDLRKIAQYDPTLDNILTTIPTHVINDGVAPMYHIQKKFLNIENAAHRAAFIPPQPPPTKKVAAHTLAFIFGMLTRKTHELTPIMPEAESPDSQPIISDENGVFQFEKIEPYPTSISQYPINDTFFNYIHIDQARLRRAGYFFDRGNLYDALKELNQIKNPNVSNVLQPLVIQIKDRLAMDQTLEVLRAHSRALHNDIEKAQL